MDAGVSVEATTDSPEATRDLARRLGRALGPGAVVCLVGPLGAGKTCFTQGLAEGLGVAGGVRSPTFALVHRYRGRIPVFHLDLYRLEGPADVETIDPDAYLNRRAGSPGGGVAVVEWADRAAGAMPDDAIWVTIRPDPEVATRRHLRLEARGRGEDGPDHRPWLDALGEEPA